VREVNLNYQGLSRRNKSQQTCLLADTGNTLVFSDCDSAEPTVLAHYSQDPNYLAATVRMKGKVPYYNRDGLLVISDPYLMAGSRFNKWSSEIREVFEADYSGVKGFEMWVTKKSLITDDLLKDIRPKLKTLGLGTVYGLGPTNMVLFAAQNQFEMSKVEAKTFHTIFWDTFKYAKVLEKKLVVQYNSLGYIQNDFGYCLYPNKPHKVLNSLIQSSVSGIVDLLCFIFFKKCKYAKFQGILHDEIIFQAPTELLAEAKKLYYESVDELNKMLKWTVKVNFGWKESQTYYVK
jgi:DNA polymerase I-like protein with 3'-5' exonuclease and polymerase domains